MQSIPLRALACLLAGCLGCQAAPSPPTSEYSGPKNSCKKNSDCPENSVCNQEIKRCVLEGVAKDAEYHVVVYPKPDKTVSKSTSSNPLQGFDIVLDAEGVARTPLDIYFPVPVVLDIKYFADGVNQSVEFVTRLILTETGNQVPEFSRLIYDFRITSEERNSFPRRYFVPKNRQYRLKVIPEDPAGRYPIHDFAEVSVDRRGNLTIGEDNQRRISIFKEDNKVSGTVLIDGLPANGFTVQALDPTTNRVASLENVTKCSPDDDGEIECGKFTFGLEEAIDPFNLIISRPDIPGYPEVTKRGIPQSNPVVELLNPGPPVRFRGRVERPGFSLGSTTNYFDGMPNCTVYFRSSDIPEGRALLQANTDEKGDIIGRNGVAGVNLYAGSYRMTVVPPNRMGTIDYDFAVLSLADPIEIKGTGEMSRQVFTLQHRPFIEGYLTASGNPITGGMLRATPIGEANPWLRTSSTAIEQDGSYGIWVDQGNYRFIAEVPVESGYAWTIVSQEVEDSGTLDIELTIPFVATVELQPADVYYNRTHDLENVLVEWYEMIDGKHVLVGRSYSDAAGKATALLPPPQRTVFR